MNIAHYQFQREKKPETIHNRDKQKSGYLASLA